MATVIRDRQQMPEEARPGYDLAERFGFKPVLVVDYAIPDFEKRRVQVREEKHYVPAASVASLRQAMLRGERIPPAIATADDYTVDGNTRYMAAQLNRFPKFPTLVLDQKWEGAADRDPFLLLAAAANARHGVGIKSAEMRRAILSIAEDNWSATRVAALVGVRESLVQDIFAEQRAEERARRLKVSMNGGISATHKRTLERVGAKLKDEPWRGFVDLVGVTGMDTAETRDLGKRLVAAASDTDALALLAAERESRKQQIEDYRVRGKQRPPLAGQLRQRLGYISGAMKDRGAMALVEHNPGAMAMHLEALQEAEVILGQLAAQQQLLLESAGPADSGEGS